MRTVYVTPLMGKLQQRMADLDDDISRSSSSADKTRMTRERKSSPSRLSNCVLLTRSCVTSPTNASPSIWMMG
jgi:hypothetical protein